jgi:tRNA dimethylallyltransferase
MVRAGLLDEAAGLARQGYSPSLNALNTVGYAEAFACLRGELSEGSFLSLFQQNSRRYAKRQLTWFRRDRRILWEPASSEDTETLATRIATAFRSFTTSSP